MTGVPDTVKVSVRCVGCRLGLGGLGFSGCSRLLMHELALSSPCEGREIMVQTYTYCGGILKETGRFSIEYTEKGLSTTAVALRHACCRKKINLASASWLLHESAS